VITGVAHVGASFDIAGAGTPLITTDGHPSLHMLGEASSAVWTVSVIDIGNNTTSSSTFTFGSTSATISPTLTFGYNRICVTPPSSNPGLVESANCIDMAYVP
jgi:hypothetical protein